MAEKGIKPISLQSRLENWCFMISYYQNSRMEVYRVLIFSQFKIMLNIIEDSLTLREFKHERIRIDGSITGKKRQMAIDRFQSKVSTTEVPFVMLLSTRAGGVCK